MAWLRYREEVDLRPSGDDATDGQASGAPRAASGSPSPPPVIGIKGVIGGKREVDNRAISIHTPIFVGGESKILSTDNVLNIEATLPQQ